MGSWQRGRVLVAATAAAVVLAGLAGVATPTPAARAAARAVTVSTGDGLRLELSPNGKATSLRLGSREVSGGRQTPLFSIRKVGGTPNLLPNPGLEQDVDGTTGPDGWQLTAGPVAPTWATDDAHRGSRSARFDVPETATTTSLHTTVPVRPHTYYRVSGWIRSQDVSPTAATAEPATGPSPVRLKVQQLAGTRVVVTNQAYGYTNTADWHQKFAGFHTRSGVTAVRVLAQVVSGSGTVWFDDFTLRELFAPDWAPGQGSVQPRPGGAAYQGSAAGLDINATLKGRSDHLRINGHVRSRQGRDAAFQLRVAIPLQAAGWNWWDDPRHARSIEPGASYAYLTEWTEQQTSRYPFSTVSDARGALTMGLPLSNPKLARVEYARERLNLTFDLGVSPATKGLGGARVPFSFVLYRSSPEWGFRAAMAKYYEMFPGQFRRRTEPAREGGWVSRFDRTRLADTWDDFGFGLDMVALGTANDGSDGEQGRAYLPWDDERGIYSTAYNHHWGYKHLNADDPLIPSYATEMGRLRADAAMTPTNPVEERRRDRSIASLASGARDNNGRHLFARYRVSLQHYENLNPLDGRLDWREVSRTWQLEPPIAMAAETGADLDGLHLDSVSGMRRWGAADDYHRPHWANTRYGLTFSYDSGQVVDRLAFGVAAQVVNVSRFAHQRGMFLSANFNGSDARPSSWFGAHAIDYFGLEQGLPEKAGENDPYTTVDGLALYKRVLAGKRPLSTYDLYCEAHSAAEIEQRFHQTLLYGIYMGCGGNDAWTEDHRGVFAKYTPLLRELNAAGWEPVTAARAADSSLLLERHGELADDGAVWIAVHNPTDSPRSFSVEVEPGAVGGLGAGDLEAEDRVTGLPVPLAPGGEGVAFTGALDPFATALVRLRPVA